MPAQGLANDRRSRLIRQRLYHNRLIAQIRMPANTAQLASATEALRSLLPIMRANERAINRDSR